MRWRLSFSPNSHLEGSTINVTIWTILGCWPCFCQRFWIVKSRSKSCRHVLIIKMSWWSDDPSTKGVVYICLYLQYLYIALYIYIYTMNFMHKWTNLTKMLVSILLHPPSFEPSHLELKEELLKLFVGVLGHPIDLTQKWSKRKGCGWVWMEAKSIETYDKIYMYINGSINEWYLYHICTTMIW